MKAPRSSGGITHIVVEASLVRSKELGLVLEKPKTAAGRRTVDLDARTVDVLREHRARQERVREMMREAYDDRGRVFAGLYGEWVTPATALLDGEAVRPSRAGCEGMSVRSLRHFHASVALQAGQNIVVVSKRLGHANVSVTSDVYAHSLPGWQRQTAEAFAAAMEG